MLKKIVFLISSVMFSFITHTGSVLAVQDKNNFEHEIDDVNFPKQLVIYMTQGSLIVEKTSVSDDIIQDLTLLENALVARNYREASKLTSTVLLKIAGRSEQGYLTAEDTRKLPCELLQGIDKRWLTESDGHFGFSIQASIWRGLGGKSYEDSLEFEKLVGWANRVPDFSLSAPRGHLPLRPAIDKPEGMMDAWGGWWIKALSDRLDTCTRTPI